MGAISDKEYDLAAWVAYLGAKKGRGEKKVEGGEKKRVRDKVKGGGQTPNGIYKIRALGIGAFGAMENITFCRSARQQLYLMVSLRPFSLLPVKVRARRIPPSLRDRQLVCRRVSRPR